MESRQRIEKQAEGLEGLSKTLDELTQSGIYVIHFDFNKNDPRSQKAIFIVDITNDTAKVYHFDLMGRTAAASIKDKVANFLANRSGVANVSDAAKLHLLQEGFTDVSREKTMGNNKDFLFGYSARMDPDHRNFTRDEAINIIEIYRNKPVVALESVMQAAKISNK